MTGLPVVPEEECMRTIFSSGTPSSLSVSRCTGEGTKYQSSSLASLRHAHGVPPKWWARMTLSLPSESSGHSPIR